MAKGLGPRWHGELEGLESGLLYGWCLDTEDLQARVVIEIVLDGETLGSITSDVVRTDLMPRFQQLAGNPIDACHGFVADLRLLAPYASGTLSARVANSSHVVAGRIIRKAPRRPPATTGNFVFGEGSLRLHGWCKPRAEAQGAATVRAYVGARMIAATKASAAHPAMRHFGVEGDAFVLDLPPELADGRNHLVRVVDDDGAPLNGSPLTVCCFMSGARALVRDPNELLDAVLESYERHLPRSIGMGFYPQWRGQFEADAPARRVPLKAGLVTQTPVTPQRGANVATFRDFRSALDSGCDVIGFVRPGDDLREHAVAATLEAFAAKGTLVAYTDSEFEGRPWFKPAWNLDYAFASDFPLELMLVRAGFARKFSPAAGAPAPAQLAWHWIAAANASGPHAIVHVPRPLYIWSSAPSPAEKSLRVAAAKAALERLEPRSRLQPTGADDPLFTPRRIVRAPSPAERNTPVTLIVPTRDRVELLERCVASIRKHTDWPALEIIIVDNDSVLPATRRFLAAARKSGVRVLKHSGPFNFSRLNNLAVRAARGQIVGLINNDVEALHDGWLDEIVGQLLRPSVGAVGAKLVWPNGMVQHGGVLLGVGNAAGHFGNFLADADWGDHGRNQLAQQVSAVTAACLFVRKKDYLDVGGMDEVAFPVTFNDVDLCLKIRARGQAIVWTPFARLLHAESASRGKEDAASQRSRAQRELQGLRERWGPVLLRDPAYHPSLNLDAHSHAFGGLALPPRDRQPRTGTLPT